MKSVNFKPSSTSFRVLDEAIKEKKYRKMNWDRMFYFVFFVALIGGLGYYLARRFFYVRSNGLVLFENVSIRIAHDCRIDSMMIVDGDSIKTGDTLFFYTKLDDRYRGGMGFPQRNSTTTIAQDWKAKERFNAELEITKNNVQIQTDENMLMNLTSELQGLQNQVSLGLLPLSRLESVNTEILRLKGNIAKLKNANAQLQELIMRLNSMETYSINTTERGSGYDGGGASVAHVPFRSPINGQLTRTFFYQFEVAPKNEIIMNLQKETGYFVRSYFKQEDIRNIKVGDKVDLHFPDGNTFKGCIRKIHNTTFPLPPELQQQYEPVQRMIVGDIYPVNGYEDCHWNTSSRSGVKITKPKYW